MLSLNHLIDAKPYRAGGEDRADLIDPGTGQPNGSAPVAGPDTVDQAMRAATTAAVDWAAATPAQRATVLLALADILHRHADELTDLECAATGKPRHFWAAAELAHCVDVLRFTAGAARTLPGPVAGDYQPNMTSYLRRDPVGVVAAIVPWNFPLMMAIWKIAPILAVGNTCVLKPAAQTPATALRLAELAHQAGLPAGVLNVVCGDAGTGNLLVTHPAVNMVAFTGSVETGRAIAIAAAHRLTRTHLELGGKAPALVLADLAGREDELRRVARGIGGAALFNAGQSCTAATRVIAVDAVYADIVEALREYVATVQVGPDGDYGALISREHRDRVHGYMTRRPAHTRLVTGGSPIDRDGWYYPPTIIADVRSDDELSQQEIFGPVLAVQRAHDESDAIASANATRYALAASVWTGEHAAALRTVRQLAAGDTWINTHGFQVCEMPHGGRGASGHGSDLSTQSLLDYTQPVHIAQAWQ